ncbi:putative glycerophosphocholine phosphodiesterase GPCPD1 homolog 2 [Drosophila busckii]|uniref:putative glycerophosphocholine phosphodiesterase GPCPD1 homolog 2 n=1 Tax=Drosophila busckii TaxID=30019 RepID=UPI00083EB7AA|nr:putative glycerophosphocholine phosphodiesterase GPCPD1 homolog 2 [Drosophila busckii]
MNRVLKSISIHHKLALLAALFWALLFGKANAFPPTQSPNESLVYSHEQLQAFKRFDDEQPARAAGRSFLCVPLFRSFNLQLAADVQLAADETLAVTGDHPSLGAWSLDKALPMRALNKQRSKWFLRQWICASHRVYYRYLIYALNAAGERVLRQWEAQQVPRMLQTYEAYRAPGVDLYGEAHARAVGGGVQLERGWLQREYVIELKFCWPEHIYLSGYNSKATQLRLKLSSLSLLNDARIEVSRFGYNRSSFRAQRQQGVDYSAGSILIYRISQSLDVANAFRLNIYNKQQQLPLGEIYIWPNQLQGSRGILQLPIVSNLQQLVGELTLPYLIIKPLSRRTSGFSLRVSFQRYWPSNWPTLDVGQRGLGDNSIADYLAVARAKGDMVQLDVQLTRDYVPIVWQGFGFYSSELPSSQSIVNELELRYVLIRELSYAQLKSSRVFLRKRWTLQEHTQLNVRDIKEHRRLFPKLAEVYAALPPTLGLIVEVKWPQLMANGKLESMQTLNKNLYVDSIIETTARYGCGRPLIFASFDADICSMLRLKQSAFPVLFISAGRTDIWQQYMDLRTQSYLQALNFAQSAELLGTALHVQNFMQQRQQRRLLELSLDLPQALFVWGSELSSAQLQDQFRALDVSGLIYEQMDRVGPSSWKRASLFAAPQLQEIFGQQCVAIGNSTTMPNAKPTKPTVWPKMRK